jgi:hypothetical protein
VMASARTNGIARWTGRRPDSMPLSILCATCRQPFTAERRSAKFCGATCRSRHHRNPAAYRRKVIPATVNGNSVALRVVPLTLSEANAAVARWHRHHKYLLVASAGSGNLAAPAQAGANERMILRAEDSASLDSDPCEGVRRRDLRSTSIFFVALPRAARRSGSANPARGRCQHAGRHPERRSACRLRPAKGEAPAVSSEGASLHLTAAVFPKRPGRAGLASAVSHPSTAA